MLTRSTNWSLVSAFIESLDPDPLLQQIGIALLQALFDHSDPVNLSRHLFTNPLEDSPPDRAVLLQEAIGDSQVPNLASEMLARAIGVRILQQTFQFFTDGQIIHVCEGACDPF